MRRREFITLLGGAVAWPLEALAQQPPAQLIGFLDARSADVIRERLRGFGQGLKETGCAVGENVVIVYPFAENTPAPEVDRYGRSQFAAKLH